MERNYFIIQLFHQITARNSDYVYDKDMNKIKTANYPNKNDTPIVM